MAAWRHFQHMADIGVHGEGASLAEAFEQTALALSAVITDPALIRPETRVEVECRGSDPEMLLVDWLNAWVYAMATRGMLFARFSVTLDGGGLHGIGWGERLEPARHQPTVEIKGATYTELKVWQAPDGIWHAQCVVDV
ncbi:MAG: archease [Sphingobacteriia bacterium]|nr:archease [Sphingobacteriia bacterium]NCC38503.1 archease [Gammaproteobacteria bacterium]